MELILIIITWVIGWQWLDYLDEKGRERKRFARALLMQKRCLDIANSYECGINTCNAEDNSFIYSKQENPCRSYRGNKTTE